MAELTHKHNSTINVEIGCNHSLSCEADFILTWRSSSLFSITLSLFHQTVGTVVHDGNFTAEIVGVRELHLNSTLSFVAVTEFTIECLDHAGTIITLTTINVHEGE